MSIMMDYSETTWLHFEELQYILGTTALSLWTRHVMARLGFQLQRRTERVASAPASRAQIFTAYAARKKPSTRPQSATRSKKNVVHPIVPCEVSQPPLVHAKPLPPHGFDITVTLLHALDLYNPCTIRSCPHSFQPAATISFNGSQHGSVFPATKHARNYTSWSKSIKATCRWQPWDPPRFELQVNVYCRCTRSGNTTPVTVFIGRIDPITIPLEDYQDARFHPVYATRQMGDMVVKYVTGKVKVEIHATPVKPPAPPPVETKPIGGRSLFPGNLGEALQLKRKQLRTTVEPELVNSAVVRKEDDPEQAVNLLAELQGRFEGYMFQMDQLEVKQTIGEGVHAAVYHVRIRKGEDGMEEAAMKEFRYHPTSHGSPPILVLQAFRQEVEMLLRTSRDSNNYLIRFVGVILAPRLAIITEFCADGSLATCMQDSERWSRVTTRTKLVIARQIASGLATLHRQHIVHRDIKPHNVMIRALQYDEPTAKIGDLGSAIARNPSSNVHEETGSAGYTAPEVFLSTGYNESADIWSYGIVVWEMMTRDNSLRRDGNPFRSLCGDDVVALARQDVRPPLQPEHSICRELAECCWSFDPSKRPSADDVVGELDQILARIH